MIIKFAVILSTISVLSGNVAIAGAPQFTEQTLKNHYEFPSDKFGNIIVNTQSGPTEKGDRTIVNWELNVPTEICPRLTTVSGEIRAYFKDEYGNTIFESNVGINRVGHISDPQTKKETMVGIASVNAQYNLSCYQTAQQLEQAALEAEAAAAKARSRAGSSNDSSLGEALQDLFNLF